MIPVLKPYARKPGLTFILPFTAVGMTTFQRHFPQILSYRVSTTPGHSVSISSLYGPSPNFVQSSAKAVEFAKAEPPRSASWTVLIDNDTTADVLAAEAFGVEKRHV